MAGTQAQILQDNFNIDIQVIHNLAHLLYSNVIMFWTSLV